jgi:bifunctional ADP-heptose synthase (sugar kinase/adenylyltransferase)
VLSEAIITQCIAKARERGIPTVVDPKKKNFLAYRHCTLFKPNLKELREGLKLEFGEPDADRPGFEAAVARLREVLTPEIVLVTLSEHGVFAQQDGQKTYLPAHLRTISDVSGAGDTVISIAALMRGPGPARRLHRRAGQPGRRPGVRAGRSGTDRKAAPAGRSPEAGL